MNSVDRDITRVNAFLLNMIAILGTSGHSCWLARACNVCVLLHYKRGQSWFCKVDFGTGCQPSLLCTEVHFSVKSAMTVHAKFAMSVHRGALLNQVCKAARLSVQAMTVHSNSGCALTELMLDTASAHTLFLVVEAAMLIVTTRYAP